MLYYPSQKSTAEDSAGQVHCLRFQRDQTRVQSHSEKQCLCCLLQPSHISQRCHTPYSITSLNAPTRLRDHNNMVINHESLLLRKIYRKFSKYSEPSFVSWCFPNAMNPRYRPTPNRHGTLSVVQVEVGGPARFFVARCRREQGNDAFGIGRRRALTIFPPTRRMLRLDNIIGFPGAIFVRCCGVDSEGTNLVLLTAVQQRQRIAPFANYYCALCSRS